MFYLQHQAGDGWVFTGLEIGVPENFESLDDAISCAVKYARNERFAAAWRVVSPLPEVHFIAHNVAQDFEDMEDEAGC